MDTGRHVALALLLAVFLIGSVCATEFDDALNASPTMPFAEEFDCVDSFDLFASFAMLSCVIFKEEGDDRTAVERALARLRRLDLVSPMEIAATTISFCPLVSGTGLVPAPGRILLDDGLRAMSTDGVAEIIAHEFVHVQQFETLGSTGFKCAYVRAMSACGGCQDRDHPLERSAYETQDRARAALLGAPYSDPP